MSRPTTPQPGAPAPLVLLLPGWQNSGPAHWQSRWEAQYGYTRVQQHDWQQPKSGDWQIQMEEAVLAADAARRIVLVAHSLGCQLVARWAGHSQYRQRVVAALLVAPADTETEINRHRLPSWQPIPVAPLPFVSQMIASSDDPFCALQRARWMAECWGSRFTDIGARGHINSDSALGAWPEGHAALQTLITLT